MCAIRRGHCPMEFIAINSNSYLASRFAEANISGADLVARSCPKSIVSKPPVMPIAGLSLSLVVLDLNAALVLPEANKPFWVSIRDHQFDRTDAIPRSPDAYKGVRKGYGTLAL